MTSLALIPRAGSKVTRLCVAGIIGLVLLGPPSAAHSSLEQLDFKVTSDGRHLGQHKVNFRREGEDLHVEIEILLEVKIAFITVFRYTHSNHEVWRDGRLVAIETETDDDGEVYWMRGRATETGLSVEGSSGSFLAAADVMPTSYWNPETVNRSQLLDTQRGRIVEVEFAPAGRETIAMAGEWVEAERHKVTGDLILDLWYTTNGEWAKSSFVARGSRIDYERQSGLEQRASVESPLSNR